MANEVKSVLGKWVRKYHWDEVVIGTDWKRTARAIRSLWRNGFMAHSTANDMGIRLVRDREEAWKKTD